MRHVPEPGAPDKRETTQPLILLHEPSLLASTWCLRVALGTFNPQTLLNLSECVEPRDHPLLGSPGGGDEAEPPRLRASHVGVVAHLVTQGPANPAGGPWTSENFTALMAELGR